MKWMWWRRGRPDLGTYTPLPPLPPVPVDDIADEGVMIVAASVRMAVKNRAIVRALRDNSDFDAEWYADAVREELHAAADEKSADADRLDEDIARAAHKPGKGRSFADYRQGDLTTLERRRAVLDVLVARLRTLAADDEFVRSLVDQSRELVSDDLGAAVRMVALGSVPIVSDLSEADRALRLEDLRFDLVRLQRMADSRPPTPPE